MSQHWSQVKCHMALGDPRCRAMSILERLQMGHNTLLQFKVVNTHTTSNALQKVQHRTKLQETDAALLQVKSSCLPHEQKDVYPQYSSSIECFRPRTFQRPISISRASNIPWCPASELSWPCEIIGEAVEVLQVKPMNRHLVHQQSYLHIGYAMNQVNVEPIIHHLTFCRDSLQVNKQGINVIHEKVNRRKKDKSNPTPKEPSAALCGPA